MRTGITVFFWKVAAASSFEMSSDSEAALEKSRTKIGAVTSALAVLARQSSPASSRASYQAWTPRCFSRSCSSFAFA